MCVNITTVRKIASTDVEQVTQTNLGHIEDLDAVVDHLRADNHVVLVGSNLLPEGTTLGGCRDGAMRRVRYLAIPWELLEAKCSK